MKYLKLYNIFEQNKVDNTQITKWSDVKDIINVVEDELNFQFKELKITQSSSYTRSQFGVSNISTFIFQSREYIPPAQNDFWSNNVLNVSFSIYNFNNKCFRIIFIFITINIFFNIHFLYSLISNIINYLTKFIQ